MAECIERVEAISAYADGQVSPEEKGEIERHLEECPFCSNVLEAVRAEKQLMQSRFGALAAPRGLKKRITRALGEAAKEERTSLKVPLLKRLIVPGPAWAAASLVILAAAGAVYLRTEGIIFPGGEKPATIGLFLDDISHDAFLVSRLPQRPYDVECSDPVLAEEFASEHAGFQVHLPELDGAGFEMSGVRLWHTVARISALVDYRDEEGRVLTLFEVPRENLGKRGARTVIRNGRSFYVGGGYGYNSLCWLHKNVAVGLVGDIGEEELLRIATIAANVLEKQ